VISTVTTAAISGTGTDPAHRRTDKKGKKVDLTMRVTDGYKKVNGRWLIAHRARLGPVDFDSGKPTSARSPRL